MGQTQQVRVVVNPIPSIIDVTESLEVCSGSLVEIELKSDFDDVVYDWTITTQNNVSGANSGTGLTINAILEN